MKKLVSILLLLLMITPCLRAQRKEMSQARSYLKSGNNLDKADKLMTDLLARDSVCRSNPKIYLLLYQIVKKQYEAGNEKLYLKEKYDTASLFGLTKRMFSVLETLDSLDAMPNKKGRVAPVYRRKHAAELSVYRANLYNGGTFHVRKKDYKTAFAFYDAYIDCGKQPLFGEYDYFNNDRRIIDAAYWAVYCGSKLADPELALKYYDIAVSDTARLRHLLRYKAEAYGILGDTVVYINTLHEGFDRFPKYPYFFPRIMDYYTDRNMLDSALAVTDKALVVDDKNTLFLLAKSMLLLNLGRNDECIEVSDSLISLNDSLPDPYFNAGMAYLNQVLAIENSGSLKVVKQRMRELYGKACPYMEKYRLLAPDDKEKWAPALYRIYLNLNMGKDFEEIDRMLNEK